MPLKKLSIVTGIAFVCLFAFANIFLSRVESRALIFGYAFLWSNLTALAYLGTLLVASLVNQSKKPANKFLKGLAMILGLFKLCAYIVALYFLVAVFKLSPALLFTGAVICLTVMTIAMSYFYLQHIRMQRIEMEEQHQFMIHERMKASAKTAKKQSSQALPAT